MRPASSPSSATSEPPPELTIQNVLDVYCAASSLEIELLQNMCSTFIFRIKSSVERALILYVDVARARPMFAGNAGAILDYLCDRFRRVVNSSGYLQLTGPQLRNLLTYPALKSKYNFSVLYRAAMRWLHADCRTRHTFTADLIGVLDLNEIVGGIPDQLLKLPICPQVAKDLPPSLAARLQAIAKETTDKTSDQFANLQSRPAPSSDLPPSFTDSQDSAKVLCMNFIRGPKTKTSFLHGDNIHRDADSNTSQHADGDGTARNLLSSREVSANAPSQCRTHNGIGTPSTATTRLRRSRVIAMPMMTNSNTYARPKSSVLSGSGFSTSIRRVIKSKLLAASSIKRCIQKSKVPTKRSSHHRRVSSKNSLLKPRVRRGRTSKPAAYKAASTKHARSRPSRRSYARHREKRRSAKSRKRSRKPYRSQRGSSCRSDKVYNMRARRRVSRPERAEAKHQTQKQRRTLNRSGTLKSFSQQRRATSSRGGARLSKAELQQTYYRAKRQHKRDSSRQKRNSTRRRSRASVVQFEPRKHKQHTLLRNRRAPTRM